MAEVDCWWAHVVCYNNRSNSMVLLNLYEQILAEETHRNILWLKQISAYPEMCKMDEQICETNVYWGVAKKWWRLENVTKFFEAKNGANLEDFWWIFEYCAVSFQEDTDIHCSKVEIFHWLHPIITIASLCIVSLNLLFKLLYWRRIFPPMNKRTNMRVANWYAPMLTRRNTSELCSC